MNYSPTSGASQRYIRRLKTAIAALEDLPQDRLSTATRIDVRRSLQTLNFDLKKVRQ